MPWIAARAGAREIPVTKKSRNRGKTRNRSVRAKIAGGRASGPPRKRNPLSPRILLLLALIILAGLVLRGLYLRELVNTPDFEFPLVDSDYHDYWARGMAFGSLSPPRFEPDPQIRKYP